MFHDGEIFTYLFIIKKPTPTTTGLAHTNADKENKEERKIKRVIRAKKKGIEA